MVAFFEVIVSITYTSTSKIGIGDGAVIAANTTVVKNVKAYSIVGGNPGKHLKYRFTEEQMIALCDLKWWDLEDECIMVLVPLLCSDNIDDFIKKATEVKTKLLDT